MDLMEMGIMGTLRESKINYRTGQMGNRAWMGGTKENTGISRHHSGKIGALDTGIPSAIGVMRDLYYFWFLVDFWAIGNWE